MVSKKVKIGKLCVYAHLDGGKIIYIGKGVSDRPYNFLNRSKLWFNYFQGKDDVEVKIFGWFKTEKAAMKEEKKLIKEHRPICNITHNNSNTATSAKTRKRKIFSISLTDVDYKILIDFMEGLKYQGNPISRNELIRRAVLAHIKYEEDCDDNNYSTVYKTTI